MFQTSRLLSVEARGGEDRKIKIKLQILPNLTTYTRHSAEHQQGRVLEGIGYSHLTVASSGCLREAKASPYEEKRPMRQKLFVATQISFVGKE